MQRSTSGFLALALVALAPACRKASEDVVDISLTPSIFGTDGCYADDQVFGSLFAITISDPTLLGSMSQIAGSTTVEDIFITTDTASGSALHRYNIATDELTQIAGANGLDAALDKGLGSTSHAAGILSGVMVLDTRTLAVLEHVTNTILSVDLAAPGNPYGFLSFPLNATEGYVDGSFSTARLALLDATPAQIIRAQRGGSRAMFFADNGNHAVREVDFDTGQIVTFAGTGIAGYVDGPGGSAQFDTPTGLTLTCEGTMIVADTGNNRIRAISADGTVTTIAGDGANASVDGIGTAAMLGQPVSPVTSAGGEIYWVDSSTGVFRRYDPMTGMVDSPAAVTLSAGGNYSLAMNSTGLLFILDGTAQTLYVVQP